MALTDHWCSSQGPAVEKQRVRVQRTSLHSQAPTYVAEVIRAHWDGVKKQLLPPTPAELKTSAEALRADLKKVLATLRPNTIRAAVKRALTNSTLVSVSKVEHVTKSTRIRCTRSVPFTYSFCSENGRLDLNELLAQQFNVSSWPSFNAIAAVAIGAELEHRVLRELKLKLGASGERFAQKLAEIAAGEIRGCMDIMQRSVDIPGLASVVCFVGSTHFKYGHWVISVTVCSLRLCACFRAGIEKKTRVEMLDALYGACDDLALALWTRLRKQQNETVEIINRKCNEKAQFYSTRYIDEMFATRGVSHERDLIALVAQLRPLVNRLPILRSRDGSPFGKRDIDSAAAAAAPADETEIIHRTKRVATARQA